jgi:DNA recombination protein RmuC
MPNLIEIIILIALLVILYVLVKIKNTAGDKNNEESESQIINKIYQQVNDSMDTGKLKQQLEQLKNNESGFESKIDVLEGRIDAKEGEIGLLQKDILQEQRKLSERLSNTSGSLNYGEIALERTLELSGLKAGIHYFLQKRITDENGESIKNADNKELIPDATIIFPDSRYLYIDAKNPDKAYKQLIEDKDNKAYSEKLKTLIRGLSNDNYPKRGMDTPGFCVMFVPGDHHILEAFKHDNEILEYALERDIVLATPGTLFSILKTVELSFKREQLNQRADDFYKDARELIDTTEKFIDSFNTMELKIRDIQKAYNETRKSLENDDEDNAGLLNQLRKIDDQATMQGLKKTKETKVTKK